MKRILIIYVIALLCFAISIFKTKETLENISTDINTSVFIEIGHKNYTKENIVGYYKVVMRYIIYFIFFIDIEKLETVMV